MGRRAWALVGLAPLCAAVVVDTPGDGGGMLSERLRLAVRDLTAATSAYDGPLTAVDGVPLGYFAAGDAHTYAVSATLPHGPADNAYAGGSTSVRLVWDAVDAEPPRDDALPPAVERPLRLRLRVPRFQRAPLRQRVLVHVRCNRPCRIVARGTVRVGERRTMLRVWRSRKLRGGTPARIAFPRALRPVAQRALAQRRPVVVRLTVGARDRAGRRAVVRRQLVLRTQRHGRGVRAFTRPLTAAR